MDIVFVSPEVVPFSKVGGLADVVGALPKSLRALGHKVTVVSLLYGSIDGAQHALARRLTKLKAPLAGEVVALDIYEARLPSGVNVVLLAAPRVSDRQGVYGEHGEAYPDNHLRFGALCRGAVEWIRAQSKVPEIVHVHDWATALVPVMLHHLASEDPRLASIKTVLTIHNLAHQGIFALDSLADLGLPPSYASVDELEFYGAASWLKGGIVHAGAITTVSPTYAREVLTPDGGARMDGVLRSRGTDFSGVLNGVDPAVWNPATDHNLAARYDAEDQSAKARCKSDLQQRVGLPVRPDVPVFGMVARMESQKGVDLLSACAATLLRQDVQVVVQGSGAPALMESMAAISREMPDKFVYRSEFDDALAHRIYGGSDFFLVPSRFEPCGLAQMYAMRYGTVPVVRATGGLRDSVVDCDPELTTGTGFLFDEPTGEGLYSAMSRAIAAFQRRASFAKLVRRVMRGDWSWDRSARRYQTIYESLLPQSEESQGA
ncbi:MAG: glycogen synthase GlgA [Polyangiales bacterium]